MEHYCYLGNMQDLLSDGKTPYERRFGVPFNGPVFRLEQWSNITLFLLKTNRDYINLVQKSCQVYPLDMCCPPAESGKETQWSQTLRNWSRWTHLNSTPEVFMFPVAGGTVKISGGDRDLRTSTTIPDNPDRGEEQDNLRGEPDGSSSTLRQDSSWCDGEAKSDFRSISGDFNYRHHLEPRVELHVPNTGTFPVQLKHLTLPELPIHLLV